MNHSSTFHPIPRKTEAPSGKRSITDTVPKTSFMETLSAIGDTPKANISQKPVICFECGRISLVPEAALSAKCHHCSAYINLDDIAIHSRSYRTTARTRGDVLVREGTRLEGITIEARHLTLMGKVSGNFTCSGTCTIKEDQHIQGRLCARELILERKVNATFVQPVSVQNATIAGVFNGTLNCKEKITITRTGKILGDVNCPNLIIEEGGSHFGQYSKTVPA